MQLLEHLGEKTQDFILRGLWCVVNKMFIDAPSLQESSPALKSSWLHDLM